MIASLRGLLKKKSPESVVVETNGVGLELIVPLTTLYHLPTPGKEIELIVHTHIRESQILLIGFLHQEEKDAFRFLTTVSGIGPRLAVNILSGLPANELLEAILQQDSPRLQRVPGVGKKMSERIVVELKDKIPPRDINMGQKDFLPSPQKQVYLEVLSALINLGYKKKDSEQALEKAIQEESNPENLCLEPLLKTALRLLA